MAQSSASLVQPGFAPFFDHLRERGVSDVLLTREIRERGYCGAYMAVKRAVAAVRPDHGPKPFEVCFETAASSSRSRTAAMRTRSCSSVPFVAILAQK